MSDYDNERGRRQRYRRAHRDHRERVADFRSKRKHGWGIGLYRNRRDGRICGVAAGLADYWDVADWVVRLMFIGAFLFTGMLAIWAYIAGCVLLSPRPDDRPRRRRASVEVEMEMRAEPDGDDPYGPEMEYDEQRHDFRPKRIFRYSDSASVRLARARERLDDALHRVEAMERYVTSRRYKLNREFSRL
jgi:phage shock protein C